MLYNDHTYMFRSSSVTILRVYTIKDYNKKCAANQSEIWIYKMLQNCKVLDVIRIK